MQDRILEARPSSRPEVGLVKMRTTTYNGAGTAVYVLVMNGFVRRRVPA